MRLNHLPIDAFVTDDPIFGTRISAAMTAPLQRLTQFDFNATSNSKSFAQFSGDAVVYNIR
jgi:hypothetical protein